MTYKRQILILITSVSVLVLLTDFCIDFGKSLNNGLKFGRQEISVLCKLRSNERCVLNYTNEFFENKLLVFSNPGNRDTIILKKIQAKVPIVLTGDLLVFNNQDSHQIRYTFIASPGDTLPLSFTAEKYLNTAQCKKSKILSDSSTSYYTDQNFSSDKNIRSDKNKKWIDFYNIFNKKYGIERARIDNLKDNAQIDSMAHDQMVLNCKVHYYKRLMDWVFEKDGRRFYPASSLVTDKMPDIEKLIDARDILISNELLSVIDGLVRVKMINRQKDYTSGIGVYDQAAESNLGRFKLAYLATCIRKSPVKRGAGFARILKDYSLRSKYSVYSIFTNRILINQVDGSYLYSQDRLITIDGDPLTWNGLTKSSEKFLVVDFWASWCVPCRNQFPDIDRLRFSLKDYPVEFISVNLDEHARDWKVASEEEKKYLKNNNVHLLNGTKAAVVKKLNIHAIPRYLVLKNNKIIASDFYQPSEPAFAQELIQLINSKDD
jgi:thiol-disulfide isomerase/thioredoxin